METPLQRLHKLGRHVREHAASLSQSQILLVVLDFGFQILNFGFNFDSMFAHRRRYEP